MDLINKEGMEKGWNENMKAKEKDLWGQLKSKREAGKNLLETKSKSKMAPGG